MTGEGRLRVLTMNTLEPRYADGPARRALLGRALRELAPDAVALQEVTEEDVTALRVEGWQVAPHPRWSPDGVGAVLAARRPFARVRADTLEVTGRTKKTPWCGVVAAELPLPVPLGGVLLVHHKPSWPYGYERERELQAVAAARLVEEMLREGPVPHVLLMGDFDASPESASVRFWRGLQSLEGVSVCYQDAWTRVRPGEAGHTFDPGNPLVARGDMPEEAGRRIDYVMVRCGPHGPTLRVAGCERVLTGPEEGVRASDHYGVLADLVPPGHAPGRWA